MKKSLFLNLLFILTPTVFYGQSEYFKTINFANSVTSLDQKSIKTLDSIINICQTLTDYTITLYGHTDDSGPNDFNQKLSEIRVNSVLKYFLSKNVSRDRFMTEAFGETKPLTTNDSESNRSKNRRVEITIKVKTVEPMVQVENKTTLSKESSPASDSIILKPGTHEYEIPGTANYKVKISTITNTSEMEAFNMSTYTIEGEALVSNVMFCIQGPVGTTPCDLAQPLRIYIPAGPSPLAKTLDVKYYDAVKDATEDGATRWKEIEKNYIIETYDGVDYFVITTRSLCNNPCKNCDLRIKSVKVKLKSKARKRKLIQVDAIHEMANALFPGKKISKKYWQIAHIPYPLTEVPTIKLVYFFEENKQTKKIKLTDIPKNRKGIYVVTKKQI